MLDIIYSNNCARALKKCIKRGKSITKLEAVVDLLALRQPLHSRHRDHALIGDYRGCRECHIEPDWLLIYRVEGGTLLLIDTGSHADLFG